MYISDLYDQGRPIFSFEFFPPRNEIEALGLLKTLGELGKLGPDFVSVTYPLDRSRRHLTLETVIQVQREFGLWAMAHLTCVNSSREEMEESLAKIEDSGVHNVLALRGDRLTPSDPNTWFVNEAFVHASDLVEFIKANFNLCVGGAAHPEKHPEADSIEQDLENLKVKIEAGCEFLITQLFFDNADYFGLVERVRALGINIPIVPGIMPVTNLSGIKRILGINGSRIPETFLSSLEEVGGDPKKTASLGIEYATSQCRELLSAGAPGIHFYTLNRSNATREILQRLT